MDRGRLARGRGWETRRRRWPRRGAKQKYG